jgi:hypothetical protein
VFVVRINGRPETIDPEDAYDDGFVAPANGAPAPSRPASASAKTAALPPKGAPGAAGKGASTGASKPQEQLGSLSSEDSSVADFDFLDEDDDIKKQPKL